MVLVLEHVATNMTASDADLPLRVHLVLEHAAMNTTASDADLPLRVHFGRRDASVLLSESDNLVDVSRGLHIQLGHSWQSDLCSLSSYLETCQLAAQQVVY